MENMTLADGSVYSGQMKRVERQGGNKEQGQYELIKQGIGTQEWPDGAKYSGDWVNGKSEGRGKFFHVNGDIYEGEFKNGSANGSGVYHHYNGSKYEGTFVNDIKEVFGKEQWEDGSFYEGNFKEGQKHGHGTY